MLTRLAALALVGAAAACASDKVCPLEGSDEPLCDPARINTRGWEDSPYLSLDGERLYFMYSTHNFMPIFRLGLPERRGPAREGYAPRDNPFDEAATYVATREGDGWSAPALVPIPGTTCCLMTLDERRFWFQRGNGESQDLVRVDVDQGGAAGDPVFHEAASSPALEDNPHASLEQRVLWFTSDREGGEGGKDLWVSARGSDGAFAAARNVTSLNTSEDEDQIWVGPAGDVAYFNRGGRIFSSRRAARAGDGSDLDADDWGEAAEVLFDGESVEGAEASLAADESVLVFARVDRDLDDITLVEAHRRDDGAFGAPVPID